jgi:streptogramin lyase
MRFSNPAASKGQNLMQSHRVTIFAFRIVLALAILAVSPFAYAGCPTPQNLSTFSFQEEDLGTPIKSYSVMDCSVTTRTGEPVLSMVVSVGTATLNLISLRHNALIKSFPLPGNSASWGSTVTPDGMVYLGTDQGFFQCDPSGPSIKSLGRPLPDENFTFCLTHDEQGKVYGGTYPGGKVYEFDPTTARFRQVFDTGKNYVRSIAYSNGKIYAGTGPAGAPRLIEIDPENGIGKDIPLPPVKGTPNFVYDLDARGKFLFCNVTTAEAGGSLSIYDLIKSQWITTKLGIEYHGAHACPVNDGAVMLFSGKSIKKFDLKTAVISDTGLPYATAFRSGAWVDMQNADMPGKTLVTVDWSGHPILVNPKSRQVKSLPIVAQADATELHAMKTGPDGLIYISSFLSTQAARYNPETSQAEPFPMGQAESIGADAKSIYFGVYPKAHIFRLDCDQPIAARKNPREIFHIGELQDRPYSVLGTSKTLYYGTIPGYGQLGGALTVYPLPRGKAVTYRNIVKDQSVVGLAQAGNRLIGSTAISGGLGTTSAAKTARLFAWDIAANKKILEKKLNLKTSSPVNLIGGLATAPDGQVWGTAQGWIFAIDPITLKVTKAKNLYPDIGNFTTWMPPAIHFMKNGLIAANIGFRLTIIDPVTLNFRTLQKGVFAQAVGADGNIYFAGDQAQNHLKRIRF